VYAPVLCLFHRLANALSADAYSGTPLGKSFGLAEYLEELIQKRYGNPVKIKFNYKSTGICGVRLTRHPDNSVTADCGEHIRAFLTRIGMDNVPPALSPSRPDFNNKSNNTVLVNDKDYQMKIGNLVFYLPIRFDIYRQVS
jgi:hypothetical protein